MQVNRPRSKYRGNNENAFLAHSKLGFTFHELVLIILRTKDRSTSVFGNDGINDFPQEELTRRTCNIGKATCLIEGCTRRGCGNCSLICMSGIKTGKAGKVVAMATDNTQRFSTYDVSDELGQTSKDFQDQVQVVEMIKTSGLKYSHRELNRTVSDRLSIGQAPGMPASTTNMQMSDWE